MEHSLLEGYIKSIEEGHRSSETEILDKVTRYNEYIMTSLRTMWGISLTYTEEAFGTELCQYCTKMAAPYLQSHKLEMQAGPPAPDPGRHLCFGRHNKRPDVH